MGVKSNLATFTRPANTTQYSIGDLVANSATANQVTDIQLKWGNLNGSLARIRLSTNNATITNGQFFLWLFRATVAALPTNGDNGALAGLDFETYGLIHVAPINLYASMGSVGGWGEATYDPNLIHIPATVYCLLEARAAYTPASGEIFSVQAETWP